MPQTPPMVSVIIPAYGVAEWIAEAVQSALGQRMANLEVIVVNDGSPDTPALEAALAPFQGRVRYSVQPNRGAAAARNTGIRQARGIWLAFLDGDDVWEDDYLVSQMAWSERHGLDLVWSNGTVIGNVARPGRPAVRPPPPSLPVSVSSLVREQHSVITSSTIVRRVCVEQVGGFDERLRRAQDFDLWIRLIAGGVKAGFNPATLIRYRVRQGNLSGGPIQQVERALTVMRHLEANVPLGPADTMVLTERIRELEGHRALLDGKEHLVHRRFAEARSSFASAASVLPGRKIRFVRAGLARFPNLTRWLYLRVAPASPE